jgi:hypothetical protein
MKYNEEKLYKPVFDIDPQIYKRGGWSIMAKKGKGKGKGGKC